MLGINGTENRVKVTRVSQIWWPTRLRRHPPRRLSDCEGVEADAAGIREQVDPHGNAAELEDLAALEEQRGRHVGCLEAAETLKNRRELAGIVGIDRDPDIQIAGRAMIAVEVDGVSADDQVLNSGGVQRC